MKKDERAIFSEEMGSEAGEMSYPGDKEREILRMIRHQEDRLPYPTHAIQMFSGEMIEEYEIPEEDRQKVLNDLYFFENPPSLTDLMEDIHEGKLFKVGDFKVIRQDGENYLVSPYYCQSGGTVLDWIDPQLEENGEGHILIQTQKIH